MREKWVARPFSALGLVVLLLFGSSQLIAQEQPAPPQTPEEKAAAEAAAKKAEEEGKVRLAEEVTVTGTLIRRKDLESLSPVAVVTPEEVTYQGTTRVEDLIQSLPQVFAVQNSTVSNGASGTATVALRALGSVRTLVLINGRRMPAGDAFEAGSDLNSIPSALVKRVDILTGGASSVYGSDAVSGVVNFVLDTEFEGVRGEVYYNGFQHNNNNEIARSFNAARGFTVPQGSTWDGGSFNGNFAVGGKFGEGKGHASAFIDYRRIEDIRKDARDYTNCSVQTLGATGPRCGGSSSNELGRFFTQEEDLMIDTATGNTFIPYDGRVYNFAPENFMQRPDEKWSGGGFARYTVNEHLEPYAEIMFVNDYTDAQIAPSANFFRTETINCDNPMMSEQQRDRVCTQYGLGPNDFATLVPGRRNVEGGPRTDQLTHNSLRLLGGVRGAISDAWSYDVYGLHTEVSSPQSYINDLHVDRLANSLDVIGDPDDPSTWRCRSDDPGCVPWNIFRVGGVTQEAVDYLSTAALVLSGTKTQMVQATLTGDLEKHGLKFPSASEGIQLAVGAGYIKDSLFVDPDDAREKFLIAGFGGATVPIDADINVKHFFAEAVVPLVQDTAGFQDLTLEAGYRFSDYSQSGGNHSYKAQLAWAPVRGFKLRGGFARAVRAPNVRELFEPTGFDLGGAEDICAGSNPSASVAECERTGVSPAQYGSIPESPAGQYNTLDGGNQNLNVETADTVSFGVVWTPPSITGLSVTADYYDIKVEDAIGTLAGDDIVQTCANTGDSRLCGLIHRDRFGSLWITNDGFTETTNQNIASIGGKGVDVSGSYPLNLGKSGFINFGLLGSYMLERTFEDPLIAFDCVGLFGNSCGVQTSTPSPRWRSRMRAAWQSNFKTTFALGWRFTSKVTQEELSDQEDLAVPSRREIWTLNGSHEIPAFNFWDFAATYEFRKGVRLTAGVNNVLDKEPPLGAGLTDVDFGAGFYNFYDSLGRTIYTNFQFQF